MRRPVRALRTTRAAVTLALVAGLLAAPPADVGAAPACPVAYVVKRGDSPWKVAEKTRPAGKTILAASKLIQSLNPKQSAWQIGRTICLPAGFGSGAPAPSTPTTTVPAASMTRAQIIQLIRDTFPDDVEAVALYVAQRESNYRARTYNSCCYGIFQIHRLHVPSLASVGVKSTADLLNPVLNIKAAHRIWSRNGKSWGPWCTKGLKAKFPGLKGCS